MSDWDAVSSPVPQQTNNDWDAVSSVSTPKLPDTSGVEKMANDNVAKDSEGATGAPPQFPAQLDKAAGMPVSSIIGTEGKDIKPPKSLREHLIDFYKKGTAQNFGDFMQTNLPSMADVAAFGHHAIASAIPSGAGYAAGVPVAEGVTAATLPVLGPAAPIAGAVAGIGAGMAASYGAGSIQEAILKKFPRVAEYLGQDQATRSKEETESPLSSFGGALAPNLALVRPGGITPAKLVVGAGIGGGLEAGQEAARGDSLDPTKIALSAGLFGVSHNETALGSKLSGGGAALRELVGSKIGKPASAVTPQDVDLHVGNAFKGMAPEAQHFTDTATAMFGPPEENTTLYHGTNIPDLSEVQSLRQVRESGGTIEAANNGARSGVMFYGDRDTAQSYANARQVNIPINGGRPTIYPKDIPVSQIFDTAKFKDTPPNAQEIDRANIIAEKINNLSSSKYGGTGGDGGILNFFKKITSDKLDNMSASQVYSAFEDASDDALKILADNGIRAVKIKDQLPGGMTHGVNSYAVIPDKYFSAERTIEDHTDTLHNIYKETGVPPDQVFTDAQRDPQIMKDVSEGKVPSAYDGLREIPEDTGAKTESVSSKDSQLDTSSVDDAPSAAPQETPRNGESKANPISQIFNPAGLSEEARDMATALRQGKGPAAHDTAFLQDNLEEHAKTVNKLSEDEKLDLIDYMENRTKGAELKDKSLQPVADAIRDAYQFMAQKIKETFPDQGLREDYFTHQYKDEDAAKKFFSDFVAKQGSERNLQERAFPTLREAIEAGLVPKTTNPLETVMTYVKNMNNLISAHRGMQLAIEGGVAKYFRPGQQPEGWVPLKGNLGEKKFIPENSNSGEALTSMIAYAPEDAALVYNNDISEKSSGPVQRVLDIYNHGKNFADKLILGLSGYHFAATTMASMASDVGRALTTGGDRVGDVKSALTPLKNTRLGGEIEDAYLGRSDLSPELQKSLDLAIKNNAIAVKQQDYWKAGPAKDWVDSFKNGTALSDIKAHADTIKENPLTGVPKVIATELGKVMDTISKPLFDHYIPRIKNAALIQEIHDWIQKNPDATPKEQDRAVQDIGNSIDNRFGEMMRDNLFWHQNTRQTLQLGLLSYSWVTGAARMLKGIPDTAMTIMGKQGLSSNARYLMGMAATYAIANAARTYLGTGKAPDNWKDFVYPKTGGRTAQGQPERILMPSHIGQFTNYLHEGIGELGNEADPVLKLLYHLSTNQDFRGLPITNANNSWFSKDRWGDYIKYATGEVEPIGLKTFLMGNKKGSKITKPEMALGVRQAPQFITDPEGYESMMHNINDKNYQRKVRSDKKLADQYENSDDNQ